MFNKISGHPMTQSSGCIKLTIIKKLTIKKAYLWSTCHSLPHTQCSGDIDLYTHAMLFSPFFRASLPKTVFSQLHLWLSPTHTLRLNLSNYLECVRSNSGCFHNTHAVTHCTQPPWHSVYPSTVLHQWLHISLSLPTLWALLRTGALSKSLQYSQPLSRF